MVVLPWLGLPRVAPPSPLLRALRPITLGVGVSLDSCFCRPLLCLSLIHI